MPDWALGLLLTATPLGFMWLSRRYYAPGGKGFSNARNPEHAAQLRVKATRMCAVALLIFVASYVRAFVV